jgi:hypothetical protein
MEGAFLYNLDVAGSQTPFLLEEGDLLDILEPDGKLLWSGTFQLRKRRFWERHRLPKGVFTGTVLKGLSYDEWMRWLWAKPRKKARILRPGQEGQIVYGWVGRHRQRPIRLRDAGKARCLGRKVLDWSAHLGSYGMGGPGFFGLRLKKTNLFPEEWMALTLWDADQWMLLDGCWLSCHPRYYQQQKPLWGGTSEEDAWDHISPKLIGSTIEKVAVGAGSFAFQLIGKEGLAELILPTDTERLPKLGGVDQFRYWCQGESPLDAWVFFRHEIYC